MNWIFSLIFRNFPASFRSLNRAPTLQLYFYGGSRLTSSFPFTPAHQKQSIISISSNLSTNPSLYFLCLAQLFFPEKGPEPDRHGQLQQQRDPKPR